MCIFPKKLEVLQCYKNTTSDKVKNNHNNFENNLNNEDLTDEENLCSKKIIFRNFNFNKTYNKRSYISEVTIPLIINNVKLYALLDSGSESSILSLKYAEKFFKNWKNFKDGFYKLDYGIGVEGSRFNILGTKMFTVQIGSTILESSFSIPERGTEIIIGLDLLKLFNISMHFSSKIHLYCNNEYITSEFIEDKNTITSTYNKKCVLYPNETKIYSLQNSNFKDNSTYLSYSHEDCASIIVPSTSVSKNGSLNIILKNDSKKKMTFKPNFLKIVSEVVNPDDICDLNDITAKDLILDSEILPVHFYNKNCEFNNRYYKNIKENIVKINFLNNIFDTDNKKGKIRGK